MATQKQTPGPMFEPLADLGQKYAAQGEALRKRLIEDWIKNKPTPTKLRNTWIFLSQNPDLIQGHDYSRYFYHALRRLVGKKPQYRGPSQEDIAGMVELCELSGMQPGEARQFVADSLKRVKPVQTVARTHQRVKKARRDKSR
jgi:hypothetical protein